MLFKKGIQFLLIFATLIALLCLSCAKLQETPDIVEGKILKESIPYEDSIPMEWGKFIAVSNVGHYPESVQLWFLDENGDIHMINYSITRNVFGSVCFHIPRK